MDERDLSPMVQGPTFLSLTAWRHVSETKLTKAITGPKSRGTSFGTTLWHHVQRYCSISVLFAHAQISGTEVLSEFVGNKREFKIYDATATTTPQILHM